MSPLLCKRRPCDLSTDKSLNNIIQERIYNKTLTIVRGVVKGFYQGPIHPLYNMEYTTTGDQDNGALRTHHSQIRLNFIGRELYGKTDGNS